MRLGADSVCSFFVPWVTLTGACPEYALIVEYVKWYGKGASHGELS